MAEAKPEAQDTRQRLLECACQLLAERGFRGATIREICQKADANVAAVNYHFGDKQNLYREVWRHTYRIAAETYPLDMGLPPHETNAEQKLIAFVRSMLYRTSDPGPAGWFSRLMIRELAEPTDLLDSVTQEAVVPMQKHLQDIVQQLTALPADTPAEALRYDTNSIAGQALFYWLTRPLRGIIRGEDALTPAEIESLAQHITRFSLAGLRANAPLPVQHP